MAVGFMDRGDTTTLFLRGATSPKLGSMATQLTTLILKREPHPRFSQAAELPHSHDRCEFNGLVELGLTPLAPHQHLLVETTDLEVSCHSLGNDSGRTHPLPPVIEARPEAATVPVKELLDWMTATTAWREQQLHASGAILLRGFNALRNAEDFAAVAERSAPELMDHAGGTTPRSVASGKVVSSTDAPPHLVIGLHQDDELPGPFSRVPGSHTG